MSKWVYMNMMCFCMKLMMNGVVVVELWMSSCSNVVVVILAYVVVELMHWVWIMLSCCCWIVLNWKRWIVVVKTCCFEKNRLKSISKLIQLPCNERVHRVRASGYASDHFWQLGVSNIRFWGENGENPWPKHAKTCGTWLALSKP
jgi:hypothetical protein